MGVGLWVSGLLPLGNGGTYEGGGDPKTDQVTQEADSYLPGWQPKEKEAETATRQSTLEPAWTAAYEKGRGPKDPTVQREGTREPRRRGAISCCGLSRQPQARSGQTVGDVRPTSLPSSSTVFTVGARLHWIFLEDHTVAVLGRVDDIRCCSATGAWVVTVQTTVDVLQLLEVPVESPQVQFLTNSTRPFCHSGRCLCCAVKWGSCPFFSGPCRSHARCVQRQMPIVDVLVLVSLLSTGADTT